MHHKQQESKFVLKPYVLHFYLLNWVAISLKYKRSLLNIWHNVRYIGSIFSQVYCGKKAGSIKTRFSCLGSCGISLKAIFLVNGYLSTRKCCCLVLSTAPHLPLEINEKDALALVHGPGHGVARGFAERTARASRFRASTGGGLGGPHRQGCRRHGRLLGLVSGPGFRGCARCFAQQSPARGNAPRRAGIPGCSHWGWRGLWVMVVVHGRSELEIHLCSPYCLRINLFSLLRVKFFDTLICMSDTWWCLTVLWIS